MKRILVLCALGTVMLPGSHALAQDNWVLLPEHATCLIDHLPQYLEADGEPIVIMLRACPIVDRREALRNLQQNSGALPRVTVAPDGSPIDEVIVYTRFELNCLLNMGRDLDLSEAPVLLPQNPCG